MKKYASLIWNNKLFKEGFLLVVTAVAATLAVELAALTTSLEGNVTLMDTLSDFKVWAGTAINAVALTAIRQAIAYVTARLANSTL